MSSTSDTGGDAHEQLRKLREQVESLMRERVAPTVAGLAGRAEAAAQHACGVAADRTEALSNQVRQRPIGSVLIAAAVGFVIGRLMP